jgi:KamA family protein
MTSAQVSASKTYQLRNLADLAARHGLDAETVRSIRVVGSVLPFKTNAYVCDELIDWGNLPDDPIFQLTFPQRGMLDADDFATIAGALDGEAGPERVECAVREVRSRLNPHPSAQMELNVPELDGRPVPGMQHKYRETVLFFPTQGQTCHAYCTYCFRWAQFVGDADLRFAAKDVELLLDYLRAHPEVTDVLFTGGDPLVMRTPVLRRYVEPLLAPEFEHVNLRIGSKAPAYEPARFTAGDDADDLLRLFEEVVGAGRHLALMAHYSHPRELETDAARDAVRKIVGTGAVMRAQAPLIAHVNDEAEAWARLWTHQVRLGVVPYYMFVERDTGAKRYFEVPLVRAFDIFTDAYQQVSGLARTVRGPVMSATPGKVMVDGIVSIGHEPVLVLKMLQARNAKNANAVFFAEFDERATWFDQLVPAAGTDPIWFPHLERTVPGAPPVPEPTPPNGSRAWSGRSIPVSGSGSWTRGASIG